MGIFGNIFGENKLVATVRIKFYGEDEASVEYTTDVSDQEQKEMDMIQVFALYYSKMLYNLNRGEIADNLVLYIKNLSDGSLVFLVLSVNGMNEYYQKVGNYADMKSLVAAPNYGFSVAGQMLSEIEKGGK